MGMSCPPSTFSRKELSYGREKTHHHGAAAGTGRKGKLDTLTRIDALLEVITPLLESAQHTGITVTLPAENWSGRAQTVQDESLLANSKYWYIVCADADCFMAASETGVKADNITVDGQITFHCEVTPVEDLTLYILRLEVEQNNE